MNAKDTSFGSDPAGLASFVQMGAEAAGDDDMTAAEAKEDLLRRRLLGTLPPGTKQAHELAVLAGQLREAMPLGGRALGEVLLDEQTEGPVLRRIKEYGKRLSVATDSPVERDVGLTVYYAAIASAVLFRGERITTYSYADLAEAFDRLVKKRWMNPPLARHFSKARNRCKKKAK